MFGDRPNRRLIPFGVRGKTESNPRQHREDDDTSETGDKQALGTRKNEPLEIFSRKRGYLLPIELIPIDNAFSIVSRARKNRRFELTPLGRGSSASDSRGDLGIEHVRIRGANGDLLFGPTRSLSRRNSDFSARSDAFVRSVRILMFSYLVASCADDDGMARARYRRRRAMLRRWKRARDCAPGRTRGRVRNF